MMLPDRNQHDQRLLVLSGSRDVVDQLTGDYLKIGTWYDFIPPASQRFRRARLPAGGFATQFLFAECKA